MEDPSPQTHIDAPDPPAPSDDHLLADLEPLHSESTALEDHLLLSTHRIAHLQNQIAAISAQRDSQAESAKAKEIELETRLNEEAKEKEELRKELERFRERIEGLERDKEKRIGFLSASSDSIRSVKECLVRVIESVETEKPSDGVDGRDPVESEMELGIDEEFRAIWGEIMGIEKLASVAELRVGEYREMKKKEKKELEDSVVSLTEENRDTNSLLRIALVEKESVERTLSRLKGGGDQKRVALLQIAERGLHRVGFGFMMGSGVNEQQFDGSSMGSKSDGSECEEEVVSLASTVERIMKNLRMEISQLRRALEESRSDTERLQSLTEKQAQQMAENAMYIQELENRETVLTQDVEEFLIEIKETEEEVVRWREACEMEVQAGKTEIEERDKLIAILKQELDKAKAALDISNGKLKLKEELADAAMAAQAAAEKSLQLTDSRAAGLRLRIEELTRQLEEAESRERNSRKVRHICWPWRAIRMNPANNTNTMRNVKRMLPEMQALLH